MGFENVIIDCQILRKNACLRGKRLDYRDIEEPRSEEYGTVIAASMIDLIKCGLLVKEGKLLRECFPHREGFLGSAQGNTNPLPGSRQKHDGDID